MRHKTLAVALACALFPLGCSDDSSTTKDQGPGPDARTDAVTSRPEGGTTNDGSQVRLDSAVNPLCEPACQQQDRTLCVTDPAAGACVSCTTDAHCAAMPDVDGPYCNTATNKCVECLDTPHCAVHPGGSVCDGNSCVCNTESDCSGTDRFGPSCVELPAYSRCGCASDETCSGSTLGSKCFVRLNHKCVCYEQADCAGNGEKTACQLPYYYAEYGHCAARCTTDTQCRLERLELCDTSSGACVECTADAQCGGVERGHKCLGNRCSCETAADCPQGTECADLLGTVECRS